MKFWGGLLLGIVIGATGLYYVPTLTQYIRTLTPSPTGPTTSANQKSEGSEAVSIGDGKILEDLASTSSVPQWLQSITSGRAISPKNFPPPDDYEITDRCPGETCSYQHPWRALNEVPLYANSESSNAESVVYTLSPKETVSPLEGVWIVKRPGVFEVTEPFMIAGVLLQPSDLIYSFMNLGGGWTRGFFHGKLAEFTLDSSAVRGKTRNIGALDAVWRVRMRTSLGITGWTSQPGGPFFDGQTKAGVAPYVALSNGQLHQGLWDYELEVFPDGRRASVTIGDSVIPCAASDIQMIHTGAIFKPDEMMAVELKADDGELLAKVFVQPGTMETFLPEVARPRFIQSRTLFGHEGPVSYATFSPDGRSVAGAGYDRTIKLWSVSSGSLTHTFLGHTDRVLFGAFSPDGQQLATASRDQTAKIWNLSSGSEIRTLRGHHNSVRSIAFSPDGTLIATGSDDRSIIIWSASNGDEIRALSGPDSSVMSVAFSPDGRYLASGGGDRSFRVWEVESGKQVSSGTAHKGAVLNVSFSPDGRRLATASADGTAGIWSVADHKLERSIIAGAEVSSVAFSPGGRYLAGACFDGKVRIWDVETGAELTVLPGHRGRVFGVAFSPDGRILSSASEDRTVRLWMRQQ